MRREKNETHIRPRVAAGFSHGHAVTTARGDSRAYVLAGAQIAAFASPVLHREAPDCVQKGGGGGDQVPPWPFSSNLSKQRCYYICNKLTNITVVRIHKNNVVISFL